MLITMQVTIGKAKVNLSDENIISPGNLPKPMSLKKGYNNPVRINKTPMMISVF